ESKEGGRRMRAAYIEKTRPVNVIQVGEIATPEPGIGDVIAHIKTTFMNLTDIEIRSSKIAMPLSYPYVVGCDSEGTVEELGPCTRRFLMGIVSGAHARESSGDRE